jgi:hypothetical protein
MNANRPTVNALLVLALVPIWVAAATNSEVQARIYADIAAGKPVVIHVVVALCDNVHQGIVPVPKALGDGQDPSSNLYWGALYGIRTHLPRTANWIRLTDCRPDDNRILERVVMYAQVERDQWNVPVYIVADAWDGAKIREATAEYLEMTAGRSVQLVQVEQGADRRILQAGGASHVLAYVGHNGLMDFRLAAPDPASKDSPARSAIILACASKSYFLDHLRTAGAHPLLLTTGLMAPEAYTLDSALRLWIAKGTTVAATEGAAVAYNRSHDRTPGSDIQQPTG